MKLKNAILKIAFLLLIPHSVSGQYDTAYVDSMEAALQSATNDTIRLELNRALGFYFQDGSADIALNYHFAQLDLAKKLNFKLWEADAYQQVGYCYRRLDNLPASYEWYNKAFDVASDASSAADVWKYQKFSDSKSSSDARLSVIGMTHFEISNLYRRAKSYDQEKYHLSEAMKIGKKLQSLKILGLATRDFGSMYFNANQPDSAYKYYQMALEYYTNSAYQTNLSLIYRLISEYYIKEGKIDSALVYSKKSVALALKDNTPGSLSIAQFALGNLFMKVDQLDSARIYTERAIETAESVQQWFTIGKGNIQLAEILDLQGNEIPAFDRLKYGFKILDSLNAEHILRLVAFQNLDFDQKVRAQELEKENEQAKNRLRMYVLLGGLGIFLIGALLLYRNNRQKQKANKVLKSTLSDLKNTQAQLIQQEKLASLGQLTAGIAHEIQNPLNFVNNFSEVSSELLDEATEELVKTQHAASPEQDRSGNREEIAEALNILRDVKQNLQKITHHGKRADAIVKGMLAHSRAGKGEKEPTDLNALADEYLRLSYHGLRAKDHTFNADFKTDFDPNLPKVNVVPQDIGRVLLNLINNAFQACATDGIEKPLVTVRTERARAPLGAGGGVDGGAQAIQITVTDNGPGIPDSIKDKIFQPFFTTKPTGQGTGLGLSLTYDIVKAHGGDLQVQTGEGTRFIILLPNS